MRYLTADWLFTGEGTPLQDAVLEVADDGTVAGISHEAVNAEKYNGVLCPGFVNAHCHLELSGMKGRIPEKTGLPDFLGAVMSERHRDMDDVMAMESAEGEMIDAGIVALCDISNNDTSFSLKHEGRMAYHTFLEVFGLDPRKADDIYAHGIALAGRLPAGTATVTPHAPYSVSPALFRKIAVDALASHSVLSVHNQESASEDVMFSEGTGALKEILESMQFDLSAIAGTGKRSLPSWLPRLPRNCRLLLVHNIYTTEADIRFATASHDVYWCFCPRANLYIENRLPDFELFSRMNARCCIGTDSYASNHSLSILEELKAIASAAPAISLSLLLQWATLNGARFMGIENRYGSFATGMKPGVNLITNFDVERFRLTGKSVVKKLV